MNTSINKKIVAGVIGLCLVGASFYAGTAVGREQAVRQPTVALKNVDQGLGIDSRVDFGPFWKAWNVLNEKYVAAASTTDQDKVWGAIKGLAAAEGDPYTVFFPPEENKSFETSIAGNFEGVGMEIAIQSNMLTVVAPIKGSPADKAGVKTGDRILKIDDKNTSDMSVDEAVKLIRGPKGTSVKVSFMREGVDQALEKTLTRAVIDIPTIDTEVKTSTSTTTASADNGTGLRKDGVFVLRLYSFTATSPNLFKQALQKFMDSGSHKLILDLRGNPGGYLEAAVDIASWFLPEGKVVVTEDFGGGKTTVYRSKGYDVFAGKNLKMIILVDGGSASASEILSGALKEQGVAKLVGTKTFGKGSVQELVPITNDTSLKVTIAKWLTPNGTSISHNGIVPDYVVNFTQDDVKNKNDVQLNKAIDLLNAK